MIGELKQKLFNGKAAGKAETGKDAEGVHHPYLDGRYHLDRALRSIAEERNRWRNIAYLLGVVAALLAATLVIYTAAVRPKIYVAQVDQLGAVRVLDPVPSDKLTPELQLALLQDLLRKMRTVPADGVVLREQVRLVLAHTAGSARAMYAEQARQDLSALEKEQLRRYVDRIASATQQAPDAWRIIWYETERRGALEMRFAREGIFHVRWMRPDPESLLLNPLGLYIVGYQITTLNQQ